MKSKILSLLRTSQDPVSGQELGEKLGISRVAVWKHVQGLKSLGYGICSGTKGYVLDTEPDTPFDWAVDPNLARVHYFPEVSSTMEKARELARNNCPHFTVVVAGRQERGRGRLNRAWSSQEGGLYFTLVLRPPIAPHLCFRLNFAASLSLSRTLDRLYGIQAKVKWPNDVLVGEKKICGLLSEMETTSDALSYVNLGIGINVNNQPDPDAAPSAVSIKSLKKRTVSRKDLLTAFLSDFKGRVDDLEAVNPVAAWKKHTLTLGRQVTVVTLKERIRGEAVDIADDGSLVVKTREGETQRVIYGDCFHE